MPSTAAPVLMRIQLRDIHVDLITCIQHILTHRHSHMCTHRCNQRPRAHDALHHGCCSCACVCVRVCAAWLWPQDSYRRISLEVFDHVMDLDLNFHLRRKTGEVIKVVDRGTNAIQNVLSATVFNILPSVVDVLVAATYLAQAMEPSIAVIVFVTVGSYIPLTIAITEWRANFRRELNRTDNVKSAKATDALINWETVSKARCTALLVPPGSHWSEPTCCSHVLR